MARSVLAFMILVACGDDNDVGTLPDGPEVPDAERPDAEPDAVPDAAPDAFVCTEDTQNDPMNCGRCGRVCGGTSTCAQGVCSGQLLLDPTGTPSNYCGTAFSADQVFAITCWGNSDLSELRRAPLDGSNTAGTQIVAYTNLPVVAFRGILIDGDYVYFGIEGSPSHMYKYKTDGSEAVQVHWIDDNSVRWDALQLVGDTYYWADNTHTGFGTIAPSTIKKRAKTDTSNTVLVNATGITNFVQVTSTKLAWIETRSTTDVGIYVAPLAGATDPSQITKIATVGSGGYVQRIGDIIYWTDKRAAPNGAIRGWNTAAASPVVETIATGLALPTGLATDGEYLYFRQNDDVVYRVAPTANATPEKLSAAISAHDAQATEVMYVDATYVYWPAGAGFGDSKIYRVAK